MDDRQIKTVKSCKQAVEDGLMDFGQIVMQLIDAGFERYIVDYCTKQTFYYLPSGENYSLHSEFENIIIPESFDVAAIKAIIKKAQTKAEGYTYKKFCNEVMAAGCIGYIVSFLGKRVVYFGRSGEVHIEHFPDTK